MSNEAMLRDALHLFNSLVLLFIALKGRRERRLWMWVISCMRRISKGTGIGLKKPPPLGLPLEQGTNPGFRFGE